MSGIEIQWRCEFIALQADASDSTFNYKKEAKNAKK